MPDTTAVSITPVVTYATCPIIIQCSGSARHAGKWSDTAYRLMVTAGNSLTTTACGNIIIDGLQIATTGTAIYDAFTSANYKRTIKNCIMRGRNDKATAQRGYDGYNAGATHFQSITNNIVYGFHTTGFRGYTQANSTEIWANNTCVDSGEADDAYELSDPWAGGINLYVVNNIAQDADYNFPVGMAPGSQFTNQANVSEDASGTTGFRTQQPLFTTKGELTVMDLSLQVTDTTCTLRGVNLSTASYMVGNSIVFTTDIKPQNRQSNPTNWDIGAWGNIAAPPATEGYIRRSRVIWFE